MASNLAKKLPTSLRKKWQQKLQQNAAPPSHGDKTFYVVLDTNIWYSAILYGGPPEEVTDLCLQYANIVVSEQLMEELTDRLKIKAKAPHKWIKALRKAIEGACTVVELSDLPTVARDKKDNHILAAGKIKSCRHIVSGDDDLLSLVVYENVEIISTRDFLEIYSQK